MAIDWKVESCGNVGHHLGVQRDVFAPLATPTGSSPVQVAGDVFEGKCGTIELGLSEIALATRS